MKNFEDIIFRFRFYISVFLVLVILIGGGLIIWQKYDQNNQKGNKQTEKLQKQNDLLRQELSNQSQQVAGATVENQTQGEKININTADLTELDKISGIGPAIAQRIIDYRNTNGDYQTIEDIKNIKGIGDVTFEKMKDLITVGE